MINRLQYGQAVRTKASAPTVFRPGKISSVRGFRVIVNEEVAKILGEPVGTILCLVEFS